MRPSAINSQASRIPLPNLESELQSVLDHGSSIERRIETDHAAHYLRPNGSVPQLE